MTDPRGQIGTLVPLSEVEEIRATGDLEARGAMAGARNTPQAAAQVEAARRAAEAAAQPGTGGGGREPGPAAAQMRRGGGAGRPARAVRRGRGGGNLTAQGKPRWPRVQPRAASRCPASSRASSPNGVASRSTV
jgi:hypothetical protein